MDGSPGGVSPPFPPAHDARLHGCDACVVVGVCGVVCVCVCVHVAAVAAAEREPNAYACVSPAAPLYFLGFPNSFGRAEPSAYLRTPLLGPRRSRQLSYPDSLLPTK